MKRIAMIVVTILILGGVGAGVLYYQANGSEGGGNDAGTQTDDGAQADAGEAGEATDQAENETTEGEDDEGEEDGETAIPVHVVDVARGDVSNYITATANLVPEDEVTVLAEAEGRVTMLNVEEGDHVEAGQLLASLLRDEAQILFDKAQVKLTNARMEYDRAERMVEQDLIATEALDTTRLEFQVAEQELAEASWRLQRTEIRAPFDGRVTRRDISLGKHVRPGDELFVVTNFDALIARIYLPEADVLSLNQRSAVNITLKADEDVKFDGRIRMISPVVDTATGTVKVTVEAIRPPSIVRPGGFVIVNVNRETHHDTIVLPRQAVLRELQSAHVFVARDGVASKREVELGLEEQEVLEIVGGIETGEQVVVAGQGGLKDGSKIKILPEDGEAQAKHTDSQDSDSES